MIPFYAYLCITVGYMHGSVLTADPVHEPVLTVPRSAFHQA